LGAEKALDRRGNTPLRWNECRDEKFRERWRAAGELTAVPNPCKPKNRFFGKFLKENWETGKSW
jgi:hypothetical protein